LNPKPFASNFET